MYYKEIFEALNDAGAEYLIVGGLAVNLYGVQRGTMDIDLLINLTTLNIKKISDSLLNLGYKPRLPVNVKDFAIPEIREKWIKTKNLIAFTFYYPSEPSKEVDLLINSPIEFKDARTNSRTLFLDGIEIPLIGLYDLITMKKTSDRPQDRWDIKLLDKVRELGDKYG